MLFGLIDVALAHFKPKYLNTLYFSHENSKQTKYRKQLSYYFNVLLFKLQYKIYNLVYF